MGRRHGLALLAIMSFTPCALAEPITFVQEGIGTGTIGGTAFASAAFVITSKGDTDNIVPFSNSFASGLSLELDEATIHIDGVGEFIFFSHTRVFVNNTLTIVGFSRTGLDGGDLFIGPIDSIFENWDMLSPIGPVSNNTGVLMQWGDDIDTSGGILTFKNQKTIPVSFTAILGDAGCYPDCDSSASLNIDDFICFQTLFALGDPYADCDGDTGLTIDDFICFQTSFAVGC